MDIENDIARPIEGEILLFDEQDKPVRKCIKNCLTLVDASGQTSAPEINENGTFMAKLRGAAPFTLQATFDDEQYVFAFETTCPPDQMPLLQIPVEAGQTGIQLYAWSLSSATFGSDPKVDVPFTRDTAKACVAVHDALIRDGQSETKAWHEVRRILETAFLGNSAVQLTCKTCENRYYTPGTPYYMNYPAYQNCLFKPPCT